MSQNDEARPRKKMRSVGEFTSSTALPSSPPQPPPCQGFESHGKCYIFRQEYGDAFVDWFNRQTFALKEGQTKDLDKAIRWGGQAARQAAAWDFYEEGADMVDGSPRAICVRCGTSLAHPGLYGTKSITKHLGTVTCKKEGTERGITQEAIEARLQAQVSFPINRPRVNASGISQPRRPRGRPRGRPRKKHN